MSKLHVLTFPDPLLREVSKDVTCWDDALKQLSLNMLETMEEEGGIGLAAPQVGQLLRIILVDATPTYESKSEPESKYPTELELRLQQPLFLINPIILKKKGKTTYEEGCLSVPSFFEEVQRSEWIQVSFYDLQGQKHVIEVDGLVAIVIQHEIDHLDGILFIDQLSLIKSNRIKNQIKKHGYPERKKRSRAKKQTEDNKEDHQL